MRWTCVLPGRRAGTAVPVATSDPATGCAGRVGPDVAIRATAEAYISGDSRIRLEADAPVEQAVTVGSWVIRERLGTADQGRSMRRCSMWRLRCSPHVIGVASIFAQALEPGMNPPNTFTVVMAVAACATIPCGGATRCGAHVVGSVLVAVPVIADYPEGLMPLFVLPTDRVMASRSPLNRALAGLAWAVAVVVLLDSPHPVLPGRRATVSCSPLWWPGRLGAVIRWRLETVGPSRRGRATSRLRAPAGGPGSRRGTTAHRPGPARRGRPLDVGDRRPGRGGQPRPRRSTRSKPGALDAISGTSRSTLTEMRRLLGVLRGEDGTRATPRPRASPTCRPRRRRPRRRPARGATHPGRQVPGHPGVELSVYRVVQEALTNVMKHAETATEVLVSIDLRAAGDRH